MPFCENKYYLAPVDESTPVCSVCKSNAQTFHKNTPLPFAFSDGYCELCLTHKAEQLEWILMLLNLGYKIEDSEVLGFFDGSYIPIKAIAHIYKFTKFLVNNKECQVKASPENN